MKDRGLDALTNDCLVSLFVLYTVLRLLYSTF